MVSSKAQSVDDWLAVLPPDRLPVMTKLRELCKSTLKGFTESMQYGMPTYQRDGSAAGAAFQSQKQYISVYLGCEGIDEIKAAHPELWEGLDCGKSCIRFKKPEHVDFPRLKKMLTLIKKAKPTK
jgi:uncharacterized protein YdhG (YjbR/CyaY superfamily)